MSNKKKISSKEERVRVEDDALNLSELENELKAINPRVFKGLKPQQKEDILRSLSITLIRESSHSGPLPDGETLIKYNSVIPDGADRIMKMAEKQQEHRMTIEKKAITSQFRQSNLGQWFGLVIGIVGIGCGTFLAYSGATTVGGIVAGGTVVSLVSVFVIGKRIQQSND